jgi:hypothetical protein
MIAAAITVVGLMAASWDKDGKVNEEALKTSSLK